MSTKPIASNDILTVPNVISGLRLVVSAAVFVLLAWQWWGWGLAAFVLAASTDAVDGWYARRYNAVSVLGRILDPLVDKVLICGTYVMLAATPEAAGQPVSIVGWMAVVVVVRELVVTGVRGEVGRQGIDFSAGFSGKLKMILQSIAIPADLIVRGDLAAGLGEPARGMLPTVALVTAWLAILLTIWSGVEYLWAARGVLTGSHRR